MEKKMNCNGDCFNCKFPDCIANDAKIKELDRAERKAKTAGMSKREVHNWNRREYYSANRIKETERAERWNAAHREQVREYNRDWMREYRAKQKEAAV